jgi:CRISPR/Cas system CMR-associated protein Cmr5 small subunit
VRSLDQSRAASAYAYAASPKAEMDWAQKLPTLLQINGLLATWAFLLGKKQHQLLGSLLRHLRSLVPEPEAQGTSAEAAFLYWVGGPGSKGKGLGGEQLRALTAEAIAWAVWLKRAAEAHAPAAPSPGSEDGPS